MVKLRGSKESGEEEAEAPTEGNREGARQIGNEGKTEGGGLNTKKSGR